MKRKEKKMIRESIKKKKFRDFPDGPVVKTPCSQRRPEGSGGAQV